MGYCKRTESGVREEFGVGDAPWHQKWHANISHGESGHMHGFGLGYKNHPEEGAPDLVDAAEDDGGEEDVGEGRCGRV